MSKIILDKSIAEPVFTPKSAKQAGLTDEEIKKIFGRTEEKGMDALHTIAQSVSEIIHHARRS